MTQLFVRFYLSVLAVLFLAWYIYGGVFKQRTDADRAGDRDGAPRRRGWSPTNWTPRRRRVGDGCWI